MMFFQGLFMARANHGFRISRCRCRPSFRKTRRQTLCDKLDNIWVLKNVRQTPPSFKTDPYVFLDQKTIMLSEDHDKTRL